MPVNYLSVAKRINQVQKHLNFFYFVLLAYYFMQRQLNILCEICCFVDKDSVNVKSTANEKEIDELCTL